MQNRRTEVTQTGQTRLSEEPTVPAASVEEASGCLVYRGGRATRTGQSAGCHVDQVRITAAHAS